MSKTRQHAWAIALAIYGFLGAEGALAQQFVLPESVVTAAEMERACSNADAIQTNFNLASGSVAAIRAADPNAPLPDEVASELADASAQRESLTRAAAGTDFAAFCALDITSASTLAGILSIPTPEAVRAIAALEVDTSSFEALFAPEGLESFIPGVNEAAILGGLTTFLVTRAEQEIRIAFVERIKNWACVPGTLRRVFSTACIVLDSHELLAGRALYRDLHGALEQDLRAAPRTVPLVAIETLWDRLSDRQRDAVLTAYYVGTYVDRVIQGEAPLQVFSELIDLDGAAIAGTAEGLIVNALQTAEALPITSVLYRLSLVARMLADIDGDGIIDWPRQLEDLNPFVRALAVNVQSWLPQLGGTSIVVQVQEVLADVHRFTRTVHQTIQSARQAFLQLQLAVDSGLAQAEENAVEAAALAVSEALGVVDEWLDVVAVEEAFAFVEEVRDAAGELTGQVRQITEREIPRLRQEIQRVREYVGALRELSSQIARSDFQSVVIAFYRVASQLELIDLDLPEETVRFVSFATAMAEADSSDEAAEVFESYAAPVGSYRAKRRGEGLHAQLQGYLGGGLAFESAGDDEDRLAAGVSAPIGVEFGTSLDGWSVGVLVQLLDIGSLASYRLTSDGDSLESQPEVGFKQVFSPGGYLVIGVKDLPITMGVGINVAPELRSMAGPDQPQESAFRFPAFFLAVDVPIFTFR